MHVLEELRLEMPNPRSENTHHLPTSQEMTQVEEELDQVKKRTVTKGGKSMIQCQRQGCNVNFTAFPSLSKHLKSQHYNIAEFPCPLCAVPLTRHNSLEYHMLCHFNIFLFDCQSCQEEFRHTQHFKTHLSKRHLKFVENVEKSKEVKDAELIWLAIDVFNKEGGKDNIILAKEHAQWRQWADDKGAKPIKPAKKIKQENNSPEAPLKQRNDSGYGISPAVSPEPLTPLIIKQETKKRKSDQAIGNIAKKPNTVSSHVLYPSSHLSPMQVIVQQPQVQAIHRLPPMVVPMNEGLMSRVPVAARTSTFNGINITNPFHQRRSF